MGVVNMMGSLRELQKDVNLEVETAGETRKSAANAPLPERYSACARVELLSATCTRER